jgi:acyl-CoA thioester hydrolase
MGVPAPVRGDFSFWSEEKLRNPDTDQFRHVNNAAMSSFFEAGRMEVFARPAIQAAMGGAHLAVVRLLLNFHRELFYPGMVAVGTRLARIGGKSFTFEQGLFDGEVCVASAEATCVLLDASTARAAPVSAALRQLLEAA